jgi:hypothetical protein
MSWFWKFFQKPKVEEPKLDKKFVVGINLPWIDGQFDHDFGSNQITKLESTYQNSRTNYEMYIKNISEIGIRVVRLWMFERFEGLRFGSEGQIIELAPDFLINLRDACKIAQKHGVKFYFCLLDSWGPTIYAPPEHKQSWTDLLNGIITTNDKRKSFLEAVCQVLSDEIIKKSVWAVDVLNEPEGLERKKIPNSDEKQSDTGIIWSQLLEYIKEACSQIKAKTGHRVSCGFQEVETLKKFHNELQNYVDFFDFHAYNNTGTLPALHNLALKKPCIIGECGQASNKQDDQLQKTIIKNFLENSKKLGYSGCMVWQYGHTNIQINDSDRFRFLINSNGSTRPVVDEIKKFLVDI